MGGWWFSEARLLIAVTQVLFKLESTILPLVLPVDANPLPFYKDGVAMQDPHDKSAYRQHIYCMQVKGLHVYRSGIASGC